MRETVLVDLDEFLDAEIEQMFRHELLEICGVLYRGGERQIGRVEYRIAVCVHFKLQAKGFGKRGRLLDLPDARLEVDARADGVHRARYYIQGSCRSTLR
jgi:hypothetical protein